VTGPDPGEWFEVTRRALGDRFRLDRLVAVSAQRILFEAFDEVVKRRVSLRVHPLTDEGGRAWFMREAEALGQRLIVGEARERDGDRGRRRLADESTLPVADELGGAPAVPAGDDRLS